MLGAGAQFESCRARLDALIDYTLGLARISPGEPAAP